jgi:hypothetical protein
MSPPKSLSPMQTDPPMLPSPDQASPIVSQVLGFDSNSDAKHLQVCTHPRVEDTSTGRQRADNDVAMEDAPEGFNVALPEYATGIESPLRNTSLGGCKDVLPALRSSYDDEDDGSHGCQGDVHMSDHVNIGGVAFGRASRDLDSNPP